jgi:toxin ParE1/3/4
MLSYSITRKARSDLDGIWDCIAKQDLSAADRVIAKLFDAFLFPARNQLAGELCEGLRPGLRRFCVGNYVYYKIARRVTIVRVLHRARDTDSAFADE